MFNKCIRLIINHTSDQNLVHMIEALGEKIKNLILQISKRGRHLFMKFLEVRLNFLLAIFNWILGEYFR